MIAFQIQEPHVLRHRLRRDARRRQRLREPGDRRDGRELHADPAHRFLRRVAHPDEAPALLGLGRHRLHQVQDADRRSQGGNESRSRQEDSRLEPSRPSTLRLFQHHFLASRRNGLIFLNND